jgi:hypothetical protein
MMGMFEYWWFYRFGQLVGVTGDGYSLESLAVVVGFI